METSVDTRQLTHVLLMEDESVVAQVIKTFLQNKGYSVTVAENGQRGLHIFDSGYFDLLVIDQKMPRLQGLEVVAELKKRGPLPPAIMISGMADDDVAARAMKLGMMDYIKKNTPRFLDVLAASIEDAMLKSREARSKLVAAEERDRLFAELRQRVKELGCLYGLEKMLAAFGGSMKLLMGDVISLMPHGFRNEENSWVRLILPNIDLSSDRFDNSRPIWKLPLRASGKRIGTLEVGMVRQAEGERFSEEERELFHALAERLSEFLNRHQAESRLHQSNEQLRKLSHAVQQSASAIMITKADGTIEYVNPRFCKMTGYGPDEVVDKNPSILKSGETSSEEYRELWETILSGKEWVGEFHNRRKDGTLYWELSTISPMMGEQGDVTHFVAVKEDISERKEAESLQAGVLTVSAAIAGCHTEDEICRVVVEGIRENMGIDRCGLFLGDFQHPPFRGTYGTDMNGNTTEEREHMWNVGAERDVEEIFMGGSFKTGFPLGQPDAQPGEEGLFSTLIALRQSGKLFGLISIDNRITKRTVTRNQMIHIGMLAEVLGNALQVARARQELSRSMEATRLANDELEAFNRAMVGRESRIIDLKNEVNNLLGELGRKARYPAVWEETTENAST